MIAPQDQRPTAMVPANELVLVSIGNTRVAMATWTDGRRDAARAVVTEPFEPVEAELRRQWESLNGQARRAVVVGSVCPPVLARIEGFCHKIGIGPVLVVGRQLDLPIPADLPEPLKVGTDRLCAAAAAFEKLQCACVVADFGTALTIDLVADNGVFLGGTILPGMAMCARALHEHTALLPLVEVGTPTETLGKDTASAMRNGIYAMMIGALREITERYATDIGKWPPLVVTGGDAEAIARGCEFIDHVVPDLGLDGLVLAYRRSFPESDDE